MAKTAVMKELLAFLWKQKKWWLAPIVIFFVLVGMLLVFAQGSAVAPFVYTLF